MTEFHSKINKKTGKDEKKKPLENMIFKHDQKEYFRRGFETQRHWHFAGNG